MSVLSSYMITLPDGSEGSLMDFYTAIMDGSIDATDEGYVLSSGEIIPTNGHSIYGPTEDELIALMSSYLIQSSSDSETMPEEERAEMTRVLSVDAPVKAKGLSMTLKIVVLLLSVMILRDNKGLKV